MVGCLLRKIMTQKTSNHFLMLYTSYFANPLLNQNEVFLVRISNTVPSGFPVHYVLQEAIPTWGTIVGPFKDGLLSEADYILRYRQFLDSQSFTIQLMIDTIKEQAQTLGRDKIVFLCYEKPGKFCHRRVFAEWLKEKLGESVEEYMNPSSFEPTLF